MYHQLDLSKKVLPLIKNPPAKRTKALLIGIAYDNKSRMHGVTFFSSEANLTINEDLSWARRRAVRSENHDKQVAFDTGDLAASERFYNRCCCRWKRVCWRNLYANTGTPPHQKLNPTQDEASRTPHPDFSLTASDVPICGHPTATHTRGYALSLAKPTLLCALHFIYKLERAIWLLVFCINKLQAHPNPAGTHISS
jgi:hypothetical protein